MRHDDVNIKRSIEEDVPASNCGNVAGMGDSRQSAHDKEIAGTSKKATSLKKLKALSLEYKNGSN
jgi:hypothetical protein